MQPRTPKENLEHLAAGQAGRLAHRQLSQAGLSRSVIRAWVRKRWLIPTVREGRGAHKINKVYALGYPRTDRAARLWDVILYAGPDAYLTGACGAYDLGLLFYEPKLIKVGTPRTRLLKIPGSVILDQRPSDIEYHDGIPYAFMPDLLLEIAHEGNVPILRRSLEALDYQRMLDVAAVHKACKQGRRGGVLLRDALTHRLPELARCKSMLEIDFVLLMEARGLPIPRVNEKLHGVEPDMYWPDLKLVVELDGGANHGTPAQKRRDAAKDALLRSHGLTVIRLSYAEVHQCEDATLAKLAHHGLTRTRAAA